MSEHCQHTTHESCLKAHECAQCLREGKSELAAMPGSVTPEMVKAALDEYVQYLVPVTSIDTPYRVDVQNALKAIADHINKSLNFWMNPAERILA